MAGIYIHIPFCKQACYYCNFHFSASPKGHTDMEQAILKELILRKVELEDEHIDSIYFGGGTPSLMPTATIAAIMQTIREHYTVSEQAEISLEANPDDLSEMKVLAWKQRGINRLSVGIQSFFDEDLKLMHRAHTATEAHKGLALVKQQFKNFTIDLIYGIPGMSHDRWQKNLEIAMSFEVPHISSYALTVEPRTVFGSHLAKGKFIEMDEKEILTQFRMLIDMTKRHGLQHYETSNFGKPEYYSRHNMGYWKGKPYLGIGPSAHSFNGAERSWNVANNSRYVKSITSGALPQTTEVLEPKDHYNEFVMTGLRTQWGINLDQITNTYGEQVLSYLEQQALSHLNTGLLEIRKNEDGTRQLLIGEKGKFLADGIASDLFIV